jgi:alpha-beta hydrolase superfamily lysophospholipase
MDPYFDGAPTVSAWFDLSDKIKIHYEVYKPSGSQSPRGNVLLVMGAFATKKHFESTAHFLAEHGYEAMLFDHRGVGKSGRCILEHQSTVMLAEDAVKLMDHVWGEGSIAHVYG